MNNPICFYKNNGIYKDERGYHSFITNFSKNYKTISAVKKAISMCIKNGWEHRPMAEVCEIIKTEIRKNLTE